MHRSWGRREIPKLVPVPRECTPRSLPAGHASGRFPPGMVGHRAGRPRPLGSGAQGGDGPAQRVLALDQRRRTRYHIPAKRSVRHAILTEVGIDPSVGMTVHWERLARGVNGFAESLGVLKCGVGSLNNLWLKPWMDYRASSVGLCATSRSLWRLLLPESCSRLWTFGRTIPC
jgi:hypothetical protein